MAITLTILSKFDAKGIANAESGFDRLKAGVSTFSKMSAVAFAAAAAGAIAFGVESLKAAANSEAVAKSLEIMARNSSAFAATTPDIAKAVQQIMDYNKKLSNMTGIDDEILNSIVRGWMAVPDLASKGVDGIEKMVQVVADVAAGTGKDVQSIGLAFVKVAGDEETALGKLMRQGIVFTDGQKEMYQNILDTSGEIAAQDYLIGQLGETYAGAAEAAANPFDVLTQNVQNLQEELGTYLLPALQGFIDKVKEYISSHGPQLETLFKNLGDFLLITVDAFSAFSDWVDSNPTLFENLVVGIGSVTAAMWLLNLAMDANPVGLVILGLAALVAAITYVSLNVDKFAQYFTGVWNMLAGAVTVFWENTVNIGVTAINALIEPLNRIIDIINALGGSLQHIDTLKNVDLGGKAQSLAGAIQVGSTMGFGLPSAPGSQTFAGGRTIAFATGGIVTGPTPALVGEAGPEAIIPLDRMKDLGFGANGATYNITVNTGVGDPVAIGQQVVSYIKRFERASGPVFAGA